jgi:hypothetical protein
MAVHSEGRIHSPIDFSYNRTQKYSKCEAIRRSWDLKIAAVEPFDSAEHDRPIRTAISSLVGAAAERAGWGARLD